jgi:hypothetical protein
MYGDGQRYHRGFTAAEKTGLWDRWQLRLLPAGAIAGWGLHPLESAVHGARHKQTHVALSKNQGRPSLELIGGTVP